MNGRDPNPNWSFALPTDFLGSNLENSDFFPNIFLVGVLVGTALILFSLIFLRKLELKSFGLLGLFLLGCAFEPFLSMISTVEFWPYSPWTFRGVLILIALASIRQLVKALDFQESLTMVSEGSEPSHEKINLLLAGSGVGVYEWYDLEDIRKPIYWSDRMFELLGFKPQSFEPSIEFYFSLIHPEDRERIRLSIHQHLEDGTVEPVEYRIRVLTEYRWFRARRFVQMDHDGKPAFIVGSIENIHEQKIAEEKIRNLNATLEEEVRKRTLQLEQVSYAKTRFLANMSHEIRTPLGLVLGFSELLEETAEAVALPEEARGFVRSISKNGEILSRIVNDLVDLSKIEAGRLKFQYSKVRLRDLIQDFESSFADRAKEKGLLFSIQNLCSDDETVVTDEIRLKQIVYNLLSNSFTFTESGSVHLTIGKRDQIYYIDVVDTGMGIPDSEKDSLFRESAEREIFDSVPVRGFGLGLQLAQNLAVALGGNVELVSSQMEKGSHFRMTFQGEEGKLHKQVERKRQSKINTKLSTFEVYALDDNPDNIRLAEIFLKKLGCRVRGFTSAKSLFAEMISQTPDLILLDIHMPEMNGFEVFDHVRKMGYKGPIWALTAYSLNEDIQKILAHGFDDFVRKPIGIESMKKKLTFELRERMND